MTLPEIKQAIEDGRIVHWSNSLYEVRKQIFKSGEIDYIILCTSNDYTIGLTHMDNVTMNGKEEDFYIKTEEI